MMMKKELFEKYFKNEFLTLVNDRVPNVRITMAKVLRHHFLKEISGAFVFDQDVNDAVRVLKLDSSSDVRYHVEDIETYPVNDTRDVNLDSFMASISRATSVSDSDSMNSEDDYRIEHEIKRHNSEDEIDHGPVLKSLRQTRMKEQ